tara:strand:- start:959 stop:1444 length:486 start_codon:yes stop_codon:yes gene_type:complete
MSADLKRGNMKIPWFYPNSGRLSFKEFYKNSSEEPFKKKIREHSIKGYEDQMKTIPRAFQYTYPSKLAINGADFIGANKNVYTQEEMPGFENEILSREQVMEESKKNYGGVELVPNVTFLDIDKFLSGEDSDDKLQETNINGSIEITPNRNLGSIEARNYD